MGPCGKCRSISLDLTGGRLPPDRDRPGSRWLPGWSDVEGEAERVVDLVHEPDGQGAELAIEVGTVDGGELVGEHPVAWLSCCAQWVGGHQATDEVGGVLDAPVERPPPHATYGLALRRRTVGTAASDGPQTGQPRPKPSVTLSERTLDLYRVQRPDRSGRGRCAVAGSA
jgi:hypothetical protein